MENSEEKNTIPIHVPCQKPMIQSKRTYIHAHAHDLVPFIKQKKKKKEKKRKKREFECGARSWTLRMALDVQAASLVPGGGGSTTPPRQSIVAGR